MEVVVRRMSPRHKNQRLMKLAKIQMSVDSSAYGTHARIRELCTRVIETPTMSPKLRENLTNNLNAMLTQNRSTAGEFMQRFVNERTIDSYLEFLQDRLGMSYEELEAVYGEAKS
jgi:hypothetical protein